MISKITKISILLAFVCHYLGAQTPDSLVWTGTISNDVFDTLNWNPQSQIANKDWTIDDVSNNIPLIGNTGGTRANWLYMLDDAVVIENNDGVESSSSTWFISKYTEIGADATLNVERGVFRSEREFNVDGTINASGHSVIRMKEHPFTGTGTINLYDTTKLYLRSGVSVQYTGTIHIEGSGDTSGVVIIDQEIHDITSQITLTVGPGYVMDTIVGSGQTIIKAVRTGIFWTGITSSDAFDTLNWYPAAALPDYADWIIKDVSNNIPVIGNTDGYRSNWLYILDDAVVEVNNDGVESSSGTWVIAKYTEIAEDATLNVERGVYRSEREFNVDGTINASGHSVVRMKEHPFTGTGTINLYDTTKLYLRSGVSVQYTGTIHIEGSGDTSGVVIIDQEIHDITSQINITVGIGYEMDTIVGSGQTIIKAVRTGIFWTGLTDNDVFNAANWDPQTGVADADWVIRDVSNNIPLIGNTGGTRANWLYILDDAVVNENNDGVESSSGTWFISKYTEIGADATLNVERGVFRSERNFRVNGTINVDGHSVVRMKENVFDGTGTINLYDTCKLYLRSGVSVQYTGTIHLEGSGDTSGVVIIDQEIHDITSQINITVGAGYEMDTIVGSGETIIKAVRTGIFWTGLTDNDVFNTANWDPQTGVADADWVIRDVSNNIPLIGNTGGTRANWLYILDDAVVNENNDGVESSSGTWFISKYTEIGTDATLNVERGVFRSERNFRVNGTINANGNSVVRMKENVFDGTGTINLNDSTKLYLRSGVSFQFAGTINISASTDDTSGIVIIDQEIANIEDLITLTTDTGREIIVEVGSGTTKICLAKTVRMDQTITFNALPAKTYGDGDFDPGATASSGLEVSYSSSNTDVATIVSGQIHIVGAGTSTITASQAGNASYNPATDVTQDLTVSKANQTITFSTLSAKTYGDGDFDPGATASSGLAVSYNSSNTDVATIVSGQIHIVGAGTSTITASQIGDGNYNAAPDVTQDLTVSKADQTITFNALPNKTTEDDDFDPGATASSGLEVSYSSSNTDIATIVSGQIHIVGAGTSTITASQAGNDNYNAATDVTQSLTVTTAESVPVLSIDNITVYPNPAVNILNIELTEEVDNAFISIYNCVGSKIISDRAEKYNKIDLSNLSKGLYFVKLQLSDEKTVTIKVIKK